ncbi:MAG: WD40 repeat domain-containing protein [Cyanobacteria bacterium P01_F01_bin.86]
MADSLRASEAGLQVIDQARRAKRWRKTAEAWCAAAFTSRATLNRFWGGKSIRSDTFIAICNAVNVDWETVAASSTLNNDCTQNDVSTAQASPLENPGGDAARVPMPPTKLHYPNRMPDPASLSPSEDRLPAGIAAVGSAALFTSQPTSAKPYTDWGDAPEAAGFVGRETELLTLSQWLQDDNCRLILLLGLGGIGKTALSVESAQRHQAEFDCVVWRSLRNAPLPETIIKDCIATLLPEAVPQLPNHTDGLINWLLKALRMRRCLFILDNLESILQEGCRTGSYRTGFEGYGQLLRSVAEAGHQSQVLITSREMPKGIAAREGILLPVRCLSLQGLESTHSQAIFQQKGRYAGTEADWQALTYRYGGNPLALKILASAIRDFFGADVGQFLQFVSQEPFILEDIRDLITHQFERLPELERAVMFWLAINREPISLTDLQQDFLDPPSVSELLQVLASLQRRSLIEIQADTFTQQPVVMEYVITQITDLVCGEIITGGIAASVPRRILETHALSKATSQDYVRNSQLNLIVKPVLQQLLRDFNVPAQLVASVRCLLHKFQATIQPKALPDNELNSSLHLGLNPSYGPGNLLMLLCHMDTDLSGYDFSGLPIWQVNLQDYPLHQVNFAGCHFGHSIFTENLGNVLAAVFSPDGRTLATCDTDCTVRLWEASSGKLLHIFHGHTNWVRSVVFSPDGQMLASGGADQTLRLWDIDSGACLRICQGHSDEVFAIAVSPDGQWIATGSGDRTIRLWQTRTGNCQQVFSGHEGCIRSIAFCPNSITLASGSDDGTLRLWDVPTQQCLQTIQAHTGGVRSIAMTVGRSSEELLLASGGCDHNITLWNAYTGEPLQTLRGHAASVYAVTFAPCVLAQQSPILASGSGDHTIRIWHAATGQCLKTLAGHSNQVGSLSFAAEGDILAAVSLDQTVRLWDVQSAQAIRTWTSHTDWVYPVAFNPTGQYLVSGSNNGSIRVWDIAQKTCRFTLTGHQDQVCAIAVCPKNRLIASASRDRTIRLWDLHTGQCECILRGHTDWVYTVAFSPTLKSPSGLPLLASGGADSTLRLWDCHTGECLQTLTGHHGQVWAVTFSTTERLATAGADHTVRVWDPITGDCLQTLLGHSNRVYSVAFQPLAADSSDETEVLLSGSSDTTLKSWCWQTGDCLETYAQHTNWVFSVAYAPDGRTFASGSHDRTLRLWDAETGHCHHCCIGHEHLISSVAYSPDGKLVASGSQDQSVRLWDSQSGECVGILRAPRLYEGMDLTDATGLTEAQRQTLEALGAIVTM